MSPPTLCLRAPDRTRRFSAHHRPINSAQNRRNPDAPVHTLIPRRIRQTTHTTPARALDHPSGASATAAGSATGSPGFIPWRSLPASARLSQGVLCWARFLLPLPPPRPHSGAEAFFVPATYGHLRPLLWPHPAYTAATYRQPRYPNPSRTRHALCTSFTMSIHRREMMACPPDSFRPLAAARIQPGACRSAARCPERSP